MHTYDCVFFNKSVVAKQKQVKEELLFNLDDLKKTQQAYVYRIPEHTILPVLGFRHGKKITLKSKHPFGGPLVVEISGRRVAISRKLASKVKLIGEKHAG